MNLIKRIQAPTPSIFKKIRNFGIVLASVSAAILAAPVALPAIIIQVAGYLAVAGTVASGISQITTDQNLSDK